MFPLTLSDPIRTEQEPSFSEGEAAELEQKGDEGQSPHEQPSEISPHEYVDTFMGFIPEDSGALDRNVIAYGEPGTFRGARLPIKASHSRNITD